MELEGLKYGHLKIAPGRPCVEKGRCSPWGAVPILAPMIPDKDGPDRSGQDLATSTLAEIYAQQGLLERARAIYERIAQRAPGDPRIAERIESLSRAIREQAGATGSSQAVEPAGSFPRVQDAPGGPPRTGEDRAGTGDGPRGETPDEVFEAWLARR